MSFEILKNKSLWVGHQKKASEVLFQKLSLSETDESLRLVGAKALPLPPGPIDASVLMFAPMVSVPPTFHKSQN